MTVHTDSGRVYPHWSFGDRLRKARVHHAHMTQEEFADAIGVKQGTLAAWETDRAHPRSAGIVDIAKRIEAVTRIPVSWMLGIEDQPPPPPVSVPPQRAAVVGGARHLRPVKDRHSKVDDQALAYLQLVEEGSGERGESRLGELNSRPIHYKYGIFTGKAA